MRGFTPSSTRRKNRSYSHGAWRELWDSGRSEHWTIILSWSTGFLAHRRKLQSDDALRSMRWSTFCWRLSSPATRASLLPLLRSSSRCLPPLPSTFAVVRLNSFSCPRQTLCYTQPHNPLSSITPIWNPSSYVIIYFSCPPSQQTTGKFSPPVFHN